MSGHHQTNNRNLPQIVGIESPRTKIIDRSFHNNISSAKSLKYHDFFYKNDWPSLSDTETCESPDCIELEGSDSSASSMFSWADTEGTRRVSEEWEKIQRTLYDEEGPKVTQQHLIDECNQWKTIFPHLRIVGRGFYLTDPNYDKGYDTEEEVLALNYDSDTNNSDFNNSLLNDQENTLYKNYDLNNAIPQLNNKKLFDRNIKHELSSSKIRKKTNAFTLFEDLDTILHISPVNLSLYGNNMDSRNKTSSIIKSEISSSKWRHRDIDSPDFVSLPFTAETDITRDSSASSLNDTKSINRLSGSAWNYFMKHQSSRNLTSGHHKSNGDKSQLLEPIELGVKKSVINMHQEPHNIRSGTAINRNISLPPIYGEDNIKVKRKTFVDSSKPISGRTYRHNKKILTPLDITSTTVPKHDIKIDVDALSLFESRSAAPKSRKNKRK